MNQKTISFNDLPEAISEVLKRISRIEEIISVPAVPEQSDELLNAKQACLVLKIALPTLYGKVSKREIPHIKKHKRLVFHRSELLEYLNSGRRKTAQQEVDFISESVDRALSKANKSRKNRKS
jgi:predicted DNA-binding transcriptional regulator AlpA